jgi:hydrogenase assembly chaperone HypC/HupF
MSDPARVLEVDPRGEEALVEIRGKQRLISVALLTLEGRGVEVGDWVLASAGLAIELVDEGEAMELAQLMKTARDEEAK